MTMLTDVTRWCGRLGAIVLLTACTKVTSTGTNGDSPSSEEGPDPSGDTSRTEDTQSDSALSGGDGDTDTDTDADTDVDTDSDADGDTDTDRDSLSSASRITCSIEMTDETDASISDAGVLEVAGEPKKTTILFIIDKSGSMAAYWGAKSRWAAAAEALSGAVTRAHEVLGEKLRAGALMFPLPNDCAVLPLDAEGQLDFAPAEGFLSAWGEATATWGPNGSTPLMEALEVANRALVRECEAGRMDHLYKVIILTDGEPNCGLDLTRAGEILTRLPAEWREHGIETFVYGLPGSTAAEDLLNQIAEAGGTGSYFAPYRDTPDGGVSDRDPDDVEDDIVLTLI